jgi:hypothetical protein
MKRLFLLGGIAAMVTLFSVNASAAEWNFYGSARVKTFYEDTENIGVPDTKNYDHDLQSNARIGSRVKVSDTLKGHFEYGSSGGNANIRQLYGEWDFGAGELLIGKSYTPLNLELSNQVYRTDEDLNSFGNPYNGRAPMLQLTFGNFEIAAIKPRTDAWVETGWVDDGTTTEVKIPKIEARYFLHFKDAYLIFAGGYQTYDLIDAGSVSYDVDSYVGAIGGHITINSFYLATNFYIAQNTGPYNLASDANDNPALVGTTLIDNDSQGFIFLGGMKLNETFSFEAGYGYTKAELDMSGSLEDDAVSYYLQSTITLAEGVFIVPEIGVIDHDSGWTRANPDPITGSEGYKLTYLGIKWQINF